VSRSIENSSGPVLVCVPAHQLEKSSEHSSHCCSGCDRQNSIGRFALDSFKSQLVGDESTITGRPAAPTRHYKSTGGRKWDASTLIEYEMGHEITSTDASGVEGDY